MNFWFSIAVLTQRLSSFCCIALVTLIASCGGGGGGDTSTDASLSPNITSPVITLNGDSAINLFIGDSYIEQGATAIDDLDGEVNVIISGSVDTSTVNNYVITYSATDSAGNTGNLTREVNVILPPGAFVTIWKTDNPGTSSSDQIQITTLGAGYDYRIEWGDGSADNNVTGNIVHSYEAAGTYTLIITGDFPRIFFGQDLGLHDSKKLLSLEQWGNQQWQSMNFALSFCSNLQINATDTPDLSQTTDMSFMFAGASSFNQDLSGWDVSTITNMSGMFATASNFDQDLSGWDVSAVTGMSGMFIYANAFNQDLSDWDVSAVNDMSSMFNGAIAFNQDLSGWDVSAVTDKDSMFFGVSAFNQDLSDWDVSAVTDMGSMFLGVSAFNQDLSGWDVSAVTDLDRMFNGARAFNQDLSGWDVSAVTDMGGMFSSARVFNQDLSDWDVSAVTDMGNMFNDARAFDQDLSRWDISSVTDMTNMFNGITLLTTHYDSLLLSWSQQNVYSDLEFHGGDSTYSSSSQDARDMLSNDYGWIITDGGVAP
ncbi:MAG: BspA family leucine-rich repeat surface protein [Pseudomonadales bacterium]|nr:BspA family leucine-rich repeat surface protein [Pseudomonadales bacterium]